MGAGSKKYRYEEARASLFASRGPGLEDKLQRKLDLAGRSGGFADDAEAAAQYRVGWQPEIHDVEDIEKFGAKFEVGQFRAAAAPDERVLDERDVNLMEAGTMKCVAAQRAEHT